MFLAVLACAYAQGNLNSFSEVRDTLLEGSELQLNADSEDCDVTNFDDRLLISMPLRQWQVIDTGSAQEIRADDFYVDTQDPAAITWITRTINFYDDDTVMVTLTVAGSGVNGTVGQIVMDCVLGVGAVAHKVINGNDLVDVDTYNELKNDLVRGDHVEAVGYLSQCEGADTAFPNGNQYTVGYQIVRFDVVNDGTPDEFILFDDVAILSADGTEFSVGAEQVIILKDGSAAVTISIFDGELNQLQNFGLVCNLGSSLRFTIHNRENENVYSTYPAIREATLSGHDMELVVFLGNCDVLEGEAVNVPGTIVSARSDEFQLFKAGSMWGDQEYIAYSTWAIDVLGELYVDIVRLYEDGTLTIEYLITFPNGGGDVAAGLLSCPLQRATLFYAVPRTRAPVTDFAEIVNEIQTRGQTFEIEIDYDACDTNGVEFGSIFGGIAWETYINPSLTDGYFYANEFTIVKQNFTGTPGPAWDAAGIAVFPDNSVVVSARLYDWYTGENLIPQTDPILCQLGEAVTFFRYP